MYYKKKQKNRCPLMLWELWEWSKTVTLWNRTTKWWPETCKMLNRAEENCSVRWLFFEGLWLWVVLITLHRSVYFIFILKIFIIAALILCVFDLPTDADCVLPSCVAPDLDLWESMCRKLWFLCDVSLWICALAVHMSMNVWMNHCVCEWG